MTEYKMCCGTTCDKQQVAAEFERLQERNHSLEALLKLALKERDEALAYAYAERLREFVDRMNGYPLQYEDGDEADSLLSEHPPAALAALKAEWQAEQYSDGMPAQKAFWEGFERGAINGAENIRAHWNEWNKIRQRAQDSGDTPATNKPE